VLQQILDSIPPSAIALPEAPITGHEAATEEIMQRLESQLGKATDTEYYKCSRNRFFHIILLANLHVKSGGRLLDIGNAPGLLSLGLRIAGFDIDGINLNELWNDTYPDPEMVEIFRVKSCDIEQNELPYPDNTFDGIVFTEVLEHIAITNPLRILPEFFRILRPSGVILFSTPNVCNLSNIVALTRGINIFWKPDIFYGSTDRHNREFTPAEVVELFSKSGFECVEFYGVNDHSNWRTGAADMVYEFLSTNPAPHPLLRNTIVGVFRKPA
jgi:2-polyprenyl-3-methyl-5-hydroxy-6-metoxy-1,4-benzoquinol methylase